MDTATNAVTGLYGLHAGSQDEVFVPAVPTGLVGWQSARRSTSILVTADLLGVLVLNTNGFANVIGVPDSDASREALQALLAGSDVTEVFVIAGASAGPQTATQAVAHSIPNGAIETYIVELPEHDIAAYFDRHAAEDLERLLKDASPRTASRSSAVARRTETFFEETEDGFVVRYGTRSYHVKGVARTKTQLKTTVRVENAVRGGARGDLADFEILTLDLYSSRSRRHEAKQLSKLFDENESLIREDLMRLIERCEAVADRDADQEQKAPELTPEEREVGLDLLQDPEIVSRIVADLDGIGLVGESTNGLLAYLVATSRKLRRPLSMVIQSRSGAGKSTLQDMVTALMPPEEVRRFTRMSDRSLYYDRPGALRHRLLVLEEMEGAGDGCTYALRALQSAGELQLLVTARNPATGSLETQATTVKGPISLLVTTTRTSADLDGELASRNVFVTVDESRDHTEAVLARQRAQMTLDGLSEAMRRRTIQSRHHAAQRLLRPVAVVIPHADQLRFPAEALSARRDQPKYLALIEAVAFLRQHQRDVKTTVIEGNSVEYIEASLDDIDLANRLAIEVLGRSLDELSPPSRKLLDEIREMVKTKAADAGVAIEDYTFTRRDVRAWTNWSDFQIKVHCRELADLEYLVSKQGRRGKEYRYVLAHGGEADAAARLRRGLTPVEALVDPEPEPMAITK